MTTILYPLVLLAYKRLIKNDIKRQQFGKPSVYAVYFRQGIFDNN